MIQFNRNSTNPVQDTNKKISPKNTEKTKSNNSFTSYICASGNTSNTLKFPLNGDLVCFNKEKLLSEYKLQLNIQLMECVHQEIIKQRDETTAQDIAEHPKEYHRMKDIISQLEKKSNQEKGKIQSKYKDNNQIVEMLMDSNLTKYLHLEENLILTNIVKSAVADAIGHSEKNKISKDDIANIKKVVLESIIEKFQLTKIKYVDPKDLTLKDDSPQFAKITAMNVYKSQVNKKTSNDRKLNTQKKIEKPSENELQKINEETNTILTALGNFLTNHIITEFEKTEFDIDKIKQYASEVASQELNNLATKVPTNNAHQLRQEPFSAARYMIIPEDEVINV